MCLHVSKLCNVVSSVLFSSLEASSDAIQASLENELTAWPRVVVSILDKTKGGSPKAALNCASLVTLKGRLPVKED
ncbi:uncharacterized protein LOC144004036 isoform X4 [Festucalex cinctus]